jgi:hypothetical protein
VRLRDLYTILTPQALSLPARISFSCLEADIVILRLLDSPNQIGFLHFARFDVMLFCDLFDFIQFHMVLHVQVSDNISIALILAHIIYFSTHFSVFYKKRQDRDGLPLVIINVISSYYTEMPVMRWSASQYFAPVFSTISAGNGGAGAVLSQSRVSR